MTCVVICDNMAEQDPRRDREAMNGEANDQKYAARFVDQSGTQGIRDFPWDRVRSTCLTALTIAAEGGKADICEAHARSRLGRVQDCLAVSR